MIRTDHPLVGRKVFAYTVLGWRTVMVRAVKVAGRHRVLEGVRATLASYEVVKGDRERFGWDGPPLSIDARQLHAGGAGVVYRKAVVPLNQFLATRTAKAAQECAA